MERLVSPQKTIEILQSQNVNIRKRLGQNFLIDEQVLHKILSAAGITDEDFVLEIGPGIGTVTQALAETAREVTAVEIDRELIPILEQTLVDYDNVSILNEDILKVDIAALAKKKNNGRPIKVVGNLPYYITTPIVMGLLQSEVPLESITVMIQKEVAMRMQAQPGTKDYGELSLAVQYYAKPYLAANVPPNCFLPRPKVDSALIRLTTREKPPVEVQDPDQMFALIRAAFNQRRKTLVNSLKNAGSLSFSREQILDAFAKIGLDETVRGEKLTMAQFAALSDALDSLKAC